jgi:hypothetical protein
MCETKTRTIEIGGEKFRVKYYGKECEYGVEITHTASGANYFSTAHETEFYNFYYAFGRLLDNYNFYSYLKLHRKELAVFHQNEWE